MDKDQKRHLKSGFAHGWELVPNTARLCVMNLYLHGIESDPCPIHAGADALAGDPGERFSLILTNPPFGKKSSIAIVNEEGELEKESSSYERQDFWPGSAGDDFAVSNANGEIVVSVQVGLSFPAMETPRDEEQTAQLPAARQNTAGRGRPLRDRGPRQRPLRGRSRRDRPPQPAAAMRRPHTAPPAHRHLLRSRRQSQRAVLREQTGSGKTVDQKAVGLRPPHQHALHPQNQPAQSRADLDEFVKLYKPDQPRAKRRSNWSEKKSDGRWRSFTYDEIIKRDKANLDIFWLRDDSLENSENLPDPEVLAQEIADDLQTALDSFSAIAAELSTDKAP